MIIFMISTYDEYGAEDVRVYSKRDTIITSIIKHPCFVPQAEEALRALFDKYNDQELYDYLEQGHASYELGNGWGGLQLHVLSLEDI